MKLRFLFFTLFIFTNIFSQINENNKVQSYLPPSPKSFEFLKQDQIPVGKYTGIPQINIPIYTINAKGLDLPINLGYNSNGFMVTEEAGWTGLGWSLSGGGAIIQMVRGFDDFNTTFYNRTLPNLAQIIDIQCQVQTCYAPGATVVNNCEMFEIDNDERYISDPSTVGSYNIPETFTRGTRDYEPDLFKFNMFGYSGEFILDWQNGKYVCLTDNKIRIEAENSSPGTKPLYFSIMVAEGHKFTFHLKEETIVNSEFTQNEFTPNQASPINTVGTASSRSYQLVTVITNQGDEVNFEYTITNPIKNYPNVSKSIVRYVSEYSQAFPNNMSDNITSYNFTQQPYSYLSKIIFNNGYIAFTVSDRIDIQGAKKLDKIELKIPSSASEFSTIKTFNFSYDYFIGHTNGTNNDSALFTEFVTKTVQELTYRLRLNSVVEFGSKPYYFEYNTELLPKKTSYATDFWGYYNGFLTNQGPFVNIYAFNIEKNNFQFGAYENNKKSSRLQYAKAGILTKMTYPTGGYSTFDYELNTFENYQVPTFDQGTEYTFSINSRALNGLPSQKAIITKGGTTRFYGAAMLSTRGCTATNPNAYSDNYIKIERFKQSLIPLIENNPYGLLYAMHTLGIFTNPAVYNQYIEDVQYIQQNYNDPEENQYPNLSYNIGDGVVLFTAHGGCGTYNGTVNSSQAHLALSYRDYRALDNIAYGAGLRVKEIISYSSSGTVALKKNYSYAGGKMMNPLIFFNSALIRYRWLGPGGSDGTLYYSEGQKKVLNSNSFVTSAVNAEGRYVGYDKVDEYISNTIPSTNLPNNGKTTDYYTNNPFQGAHVGYAVGLNLPSLRNTYNNGLVVKQEIYDKSNVLQERTSNLYEYTKLRCFYGMKQTFYMQYALTSYPLAVSLKSKYHVGVYPIIASHTSLKNSTNVKYFANDSIISRVNYEYNSFNQVTYTRELLSNNDIRESRAMYPKDITNATLYPIAMQMAANNVLAPVIKKELKVNGEITATEEYEYFYRLGSNNGFTRPDIYSLRKYKTAKGNNVLEDKITYHIYDRLGNPLYTTDQAGLQTCYIWGYNLQYPIAKIDDLDYSLIDSYSGEVRTSSNVEYNDVTENLLRTKLNVLRSNFPTKKITTLTYDPLIGVKSITDVNGSTSYYQYDDQLRLQYIKDDKGYILNTYDYHYR